MSVCSVCQDKKLLCCSPKGPISHTAAVGLYTLMTAYTHIDTHTHMHTNLQLPIDYNMLEYAMNAHAHVQTHAH